MLVLGVLSGTSLDGLDVAVADLRWQGSTIVLRPLGEHEHPWPHELRARLSAVLPPAATSAEEICQLDTLVGQQVAAAVAGLDADLVASHGQTIFHWVEDGSARGTLQLGQPAWIAEATGLPVVADLRARDIAAGGHGAPLASILDVLWLAGGPTPTAALNLGGIANVTLVDAEPPVAFDTGPGNCLLDVAAERVSSGRMRSDVDGRLAAAGTVRDDLLARLLAEPYFAATPPKSTGRELFHAGLVDNALAGLPPVTGTDLLATLTELTAVTVAQACSGVGRVVASGGGVRNPALLAALRRRLDGAELITCDELGLPAGAKEAYLFALLGFLTFHQVPGVLAGLTGSTTPRILGSITPGAAALRLPPPGRPPTGVVVDRRSS